MRSVSVLVAMLVLGALTIWAYRRHIFDSVLGLDAAQTKDAMSAQNVTVTLKRASGTTDQPYGPMFDPRGVTVSTAPSGPAYSPRYQNAVAFVHRDGGPRGLTDNLPNLPTDTLSVWRGDEPSARWGTWPDPKAGRINVIPGLGDVQNFQEDLYDLSTGVPRSSRGGGGGFARLN